MRDINAGQVRMGLDLRHSDAGVTRMASQMSMIILIKTIAYVFASKTVAGCI